MKPGKSCGVQTTRTVLFILNAVFLLFGLVLLGFGIYLKVSQKFDVALSKHVNVQVIGSDGIATVGTILIIVGVCSVLVSVFGVLGAWLYRRFYLFMYASILSILIILEFIAFIIAMNSRKKIRDSFDDDLKSIFVKAYNGTDPKAVDYFEDLEVEFRCCGVLNQSDYRDVGREVPLSCHKDKIKRNPIFQIGCAEAFIEWIWDELPIIGGIVFAALIIEIFGVISSISLGISIANYSVGQRFSNL